MVEEGNLALKTEHRTVHPRQAEQGTSIVDEVPSWKIIGAVNDEVPALEAFQNVPGVEALVEDLDVHVRVKSLASLRRFNLRPAHILGCVGGVEGCSHRRRRCQSSPNDRLQRRRGTRKRESLSLLPQRSAHWIHPSAVDLPPQRWEGDVTSVPSDINHGSASEPSTSRKRRQWTFSSNHFSTSMAAEHPGPQR